MAVAMDHLALNDDFTRGQQREPEGWHRMDAVTLSLKPRSLGAWKHGQQTKVTKSTAGHNLSAQRTNLTPERPPLRPVDFF